MFRKRQRVAKAVYLVDRKVDRKVMPRGEESFKNKRLAELTIGVGRGKKNSIL